MHARKLEMPKLAPDDLRRSCARFCHAAGGQLEQIRSSQSVCESQRIGYVGIMKSDDLITVDPEILGGTPVFKGTRVPVNIIFIYLSSYYLQV
jgi:hypothetical protein